MSPHQKNQWQSVTSGINTTYKKIERLYQIGKEQFRKYTLDFFKLTGHYELRSLVPTRLAGKISE